MASPFPAEKQRRAGFSLHLESGHARLLLTERRICEYFSVERLALSLDAVPSRLNLSAGQEPFRHHRAHLEALSLYADEQDLLRWLQRGLAGQGLSDLEVHLADGELSIAGQLDGPEPAPFLARIRPMSAGLVDERAVLISAYETRLFAPSRLSAPGLAQLLLRALGLGPHLQGPTLAILDPTDPLLVEICARLGWKLPHRESLRVDDLELEGGRLHLRASRPSPTPLLGPRSLLHILDEQAPKNLAFLADYEAKSLYASTEHSLGEGELVRALRTYERQAELHPEHPFLQLRRMQLLATDPAHSAELLRVARAQLAHRPHDLDARLALALATAQGADAAQAVAQLDALAQDLERSGDPLQAAQVHCAVALLSEAHDPQRAIQALEAALRLRRHLPAALRALARLTEANQQWAASLRYRQRLLAMQPEGAERRALYLDLARMALGPAEDLQAARLACEAILREAPEDAQALRLLADVLATDGQILLAVRTLDRVASLHQSAADRAAAAESLTRLGDLWRSPSDHQDELAAQLRYEQALAALPGHAPAIYGLAQLEIARGHATAARLHLEQLLRREALPAPLDRHALRLQLGELLAGPLGDPQGAVSEWQKVLDGPAEQAQQAMDRLAPVLLALDRPADLARLWQLAVARPQPDEQRAEQWVQLARLWRDRLGEPERASEALARACALRPADLTLRREHIALLRALDEPVALAQTLADYAERAQAPEAIVEALTERAQLLAQRLNRSEEAVHIYGRALAIDAEHRPALEGLLPLLRDRERHVELAQLLRRLAPLGAPGVERAQAWRQLAQLSEEVLEDRAAAIEAYAQVCEETPEDALSAAALARLYLREGQPARALPLYERVHALGAQEGYDEPESRLARETAEVLIALHRVAEARPWWQTAARANPQDEAVYTLVQDTCLAEGEVAEIVEFYTQMLPRVRPPALRHRLLTVAGRLAWRQLKRPQQAAGLLDEALQIEADEPLLRLRLEVAEHLADYPRIVALVRALYPQLGARAQTALRERFAQIWADVAQGLAADAPKIADSAPPAEAPAARGAAQVAGRRRTGAPQVAPGTPSGGIGAPAAERGEGAAQQEARPPWAMDSSAPPAAAPAIVESAPPAGAQQEARPPWAMDSSAPPAAAPAIVESAPPTGAQQEARPPWAMDSSAPPAAAPAIVESAPPAGAQQEARPPWAMDSSAPPAAAPVIGAAQVRGRRRAGAPQEAAPAARASRTTAAPAPQKGGATVQPLPPSAEEIQRQLTELREQAQAAQGDEAAAAWLKLAEFLRDAAFDVEGALPAFERSLRLAEGPAHPAFRVALESLEDIYAVQDQVEARLRLYDLRITSGLEEAAPVQLRKARLLRAQQRLPEALEAAQAARSLGEEALELRVALLTACDQRAQAAQALLEDLDELGRSEGARRRWQAAELLTEEAPAQALALFEQAAEQLPTELPLIEAWLQHTLRPEFAAAQLAALWARVALYADDDLGRHQRASLLQRIIDLAQTLDDPAQIQRALRARLALSPEDPEGWLQLAQLAQQSADPGQAAQAWLRLAELSLPGPEQGRFYAQAAEALTAAQQPQAAEQALRAAQEAGWVAEGPAADGEGLLDEHRAPDPAPGGS